MKFENGNYVNYRTSSNYTVQNDFVNYDRNVCTELQRDGKFSQSPPFNQLGPTPQKNCIFYNYTLPYNYPYAGGRRTPDPINYWYYPYYKDPTFYNNPLLIQKPS